MADIVLLKNRLQGLSDRLTAKDKLGKEYKQIVSDSLARINAKIIKILADHDKQVQDIREGSAVNLEKTRAELAMQKEQLKIANEATLEVARRDQGKLQTNLEATNKQLKKLQDEMNKPNPNIQIMQGDIVLLRQELQTATNASAAATGQIAALTARLVAYDGIQAKMDELVKNLLTKIGEILAQVENMSINKGDVDELKQLLRDTENLFPKDDGAPPSGDDGDGEGGLLSGLFGSSSNDVRAAGGFKPGGLRVHTPPPDDADSGDEHEEVATHQEKTGLGGFLQAKQPRIANTAPGQSELGPLKETQRKKRWGRGGKTKRRRGKKTMHRGGYVEAKKSATRTRRNRPRTSSRRRSSSSSSSASSNPRQKAMKGR